MLTLVLIVAVAYVLVVASIGWILLSGESGSENGEAFVELHASWTARAFEGIAYTAAALAAGIRARDYRRASGAGWPLMVAASIIAFPVLALVGQGNQPIVRSHPLAAGAAALGYSILLQGVGWPQRKSTIERRCGVGVAKADRRLAITVAAAAGIVDLFALLGSVAAGVGGPANGDVNDLVAACLVGVGPVAAADLTACVWSVGIVGQLHRTKTYLLRAGEVSAS